MIVIINRCLGMQAKHGNWAMFCQSPGLAGMKIEKTVFFWKDHDEVGIVMSEVFEDTFFDFWFTDVVNFGIKVFELVFPAA